MNIIAIFEDEDDKHLVGQLARHVGIELAREPVTLKGNDTKTLRKTIRQQSNADHDRLVLILDADHLPTGGPDKRWDEVISVLRETGYSLPDDISTENGLICDLKDNRRVAVWLFPDCKSPGALEEFMIQTLISPNDPLLRCACNVVRDLEERRFPVKYNRKAEVRTWLAWQKRPGLPPGRAVSEKVLVPDEIRLASFFVWLRQAFT